MRQHTQHLSNARKKKYCDGMVHQQYLDFKSGKKDCTVFSLHFVYQGN